jgi:hypothetical protein
VAAVDIFDGTISITGRLPRPGGSVEIAEVGAGKVLKSIGFPDHEELPPDQAENKRRKQRRKDALPRATVIRVNEVTGLIFKNSSRLYEADGDSNTPEARAQERRIDVQVAARGDVPLLWQARGPDQDPHHLMIVRERKTTDPKRRRWAFARETLSGKSLAFTAGVDDELGADQVLSYRGFWLYKEGRPAVLLSHGKPEDKQGRDGDFAWDMFTDPPTRYRKSGGAWSAV